MNRRQFVAKGLAGIGVVGVGSSAFASNGSDAQMTATASPEQVITVGAEGATSGSVSPSSVHAEGFAALLTPVAVGSVLDGARVATIDVDEWGRGTAEIVIEGGASYHIDVCTKDESLGHEPVASTQRFDLFVRNGGDGSVATSSNVDGAIAALAGAIRANEAEATVALLSKSEYWARGC
ncbi:MAG: hypothetical protein ACJAYU_001107 [Bradymonadia bacterium]|jgi:hypothetical protein